MIFARARHARDYTDPNSIETIPVNVVFAENGAHEDTEVTLSLCRHDHINDGPADEDTWGYEVDMTPDEAENLAQSLRNAADKARKAALRP